MTTFVRRLHGYRLPMVLSALAALSLPATVAAQGDGPHTYLPAPVGVHAVTPIYLDLASNMNFAQDILIEGADLKSEVGVVSYVHFLSIGNRLSQIFVNGIYGSIGGSVEVGEDPPATVPFAPGSTVDVPNTSGLADPYVALRVGLLGAPALMPADFVQHQQEFQVYAMIGASLPLGDYDSDRPINLGTNRWAIRLALPMVVPIGKPASQIFLEIVPSLMLYTDNGDPFRASVREQDPLALVETHLSRSLTKKLWGSVDLRYSLGGETTTDHVADDNQIDQLGGGLTLGYAFNPKVGCYASYGELLIENDNSHGKMVRGRCTFSF